MERTILAALVISGFIAAERACGDDVRYYEQNGITYRESRRVVQRPIADTQYESRDQVVYREQVQTDTVESLRAVHTPVVEYQCVNYLRGRWNPFVSPYYEQRIVPVTRWETRQEVVRTPVTRREMVPETRVVQVPVTRYRMADEEVVTRVAVGPASNVGGIARLESDPPRQSTTWRSAPGTIQR